MGGINKLMGGINKLEEGERQLNEDLQLKFEAIQQMDEQDQLTIKSLLEGMILKHQAKQMLGR